MKTAIIGTEIVIADRYRPAMGIPRYLRCGRQMIHLPPGDRAKA